MVRTRSIPARWKAMSYISEGVLRSLANAGGKACAPWANMWSMAAPGRSTSTGLILAAALAADMKLRASRTVSR